MKLFAIIVAAILTSVVIVASFMGYAAKRQREFVLWSKSLSLAVRNADTLYERCTSGDAAEDWARLQDQLDQMEQTLKSADGNAETGALWRARDTIKQYQAEIDQRWKKAMAQPIKSPHSPR